MLRISFDKSTYADVVLHAKESLEKEICGVLVGEVCEDNEGLFVLVKAAIRGKGAQQGRAHVTFTQQTWNAIHEEKDKKYSRLQIVGWYHSHPGFGVEISDMDRFIHENFFPSETQIGLVTDPLSGEVAVFINSSEGVRNVDRCWIDTREHRCYVPRSQGVQSQLDDYRPLTLDGPMLPRIMTADWPKARSHIRFRVSRWSLVDQVGPDSIQFATPRECTDP